MKFSVKLRGGIFRQHYKFLLSENPTRSWVNDIYLSSEISRNKRSIVSMASFISTLKVSSGTDSQSSSEESYATM